LTNPLENLLQPRSIAIVGASSHSRPDFVVALQNLGFKGALYLVNIKEPEVHGIKTYMNVNDIPGPVDYVITAIPAAAVPGLIDDCARKGVKVAHLYTGRFGETGRAQDASLEQEVLRRARKGGVRIIGPNCMGLYYPRLGIGWSDDFPTDSGPAEGVSLVSRDAFVKGISIFGRIDEIVFEPNRIIIIDDKPGSRPYFSNKIQVWGYCKAFREMYHPDLPLFGALRQEDNGKIVWLEWFKEDQASLVDAMVRRIQVVLSGKEKPQTNANSRRCQPCRFKSSCPVQVE
jgi:predicted CoA-binding protein